MTDKELDELEEAMEEQREALYEVLAEDLGDEPEDYRPGRKPVTDGGN